MLYMYIARGLEGRIFSTARKSQRTRRRSRGGECVRTGMLVEVFCLIIACGHTRFSGRAASAGSAKSEKAPAKLTVEDVLLGPKLAAPDRERASSTTTTKLSLTKRDGELWCSRTSGSRRSGSGPRSKIACPR